MSDDTHKRCVEALGSEVLTIERKLFGDDSLNMISLEFLTHKVETIRDILDAFLPMSSHQRMVDFLNKLVEESGRCCESYYEESSNSKRGIIAGQKTSTEIIKGILYGK